MSNKMKPDTSTIGSYNASYGNVSSNSRSKDIGAVLKEVNRMNGTKMMNKGSKVKG